MAMNPPVRCAFTAAVNHLLLISKQPQPSRRVQELLETKIYKYYSTTVGGLGIVDKFLNAANNNKLMQDDYSPTSIAHLFTPEIPQNGQR